MEEIKAGEYVRDTEGEIYKADEIFLKHANVEIKKHSFNIIDLIEEGDVITLKNGRIYEVLRISWSKSKGTHIHIINPLRLEGGIDIFKEDIKSIVTKEMFQNIEYRVESN